MSFVYNYMMVQFLTSEVNAKCHINSHTDIIVDANILDDSETRKDSI